MAGSTRPSVGDSQWELVVQPAFKPLPLIGITPQLPGWCQRENLCERSGRDPALFVSVDLCSHLALITLTRLENLHLSASLHSWHPVWFFYLSLQSFRVMAISLLLSGTMNRSVLGDALLTLCLCVCAFSLQKRWRWRRLVRLPSWGLENSSSL